MKKQYILAVYIISLFVGLITIQAQQATSATGGDFYGSTGSVSFSVGQVMYHSLSSSNGAITEGIIHPFELQIITGVNEYANITYSSWIYPNPVTDVLTLLINLDKLKNAGYRLYDISGKLLEQKHLIKENTKINFSNRSTGVYLLTIVSGDITINTFKVVKL